MREFVNLLQSFVAVCVLFLRLGTFSSLTLPRQGSRIEATNMILKVIIGLRGDAGDE